MTDPFAALAATPMRPPSRYQGAFWFALLLATALTLGGVSVAVGAYEAAADPQTVVLAYFAALGDGDAAAALGYGDVPDGSHDLLTSEFLAAQNAVAPISDVAVHAVHRNGDHASVDVTYTLDFASGRSTVADTVGVLRHGHDWRLVRTAVPESLDPGDGSTLASFAGVRIPSGDYPMFPGAVPVTYATPNLEAADGSRVVRFNGSAKLQVDAQVSAAGRRIITPAVRAALVACLAGRGSPESLCPLPDPDQGVPGSLRGTAAGRASGPLDLSVDSADGRIDIGGEVDVRATYQQLDQNNLASSAKVSTVGLRAHCFATAPGVIVWDVAP